MILLCPESVFLRTAPAGSVTAANSASCSDFAAGDNL
jgi:hypothetical protein